MISYGNKLQHKMPDLIQVGPYEFLNTSGKHNYKEFFNVLMEETT